jgi:hypothetical protein
MPVEVHENGSMSITGEDGIALYRLVLLYHALKLQANTGLKASRVSAVACAKRLGYVGRTAKTLLADMERKHPELKTATPPCGFQD